jgi:mono/diheme cytochrome c family protein
MRPERLLPIILLVVGVAVALCVYREKTQPVPVPAGLQNQPGPRLFFQQGCVSCHTVTAIPGARGTLGPGLDDVGNRARLLDPAGAGKGYLRESILEPGKVVRKNFVNAMPSFAAKMSERELSQLVDWLSTLRLPQATGGSGA